MNSFPGLDFGICRSSRCTGVSSNSWALA